MGLFKTKSTSPEPMRLLDPVEPSIYLYPQCVGTEQVTLSLRQKINQITETQDGRIVVNVAAKANLRQVKHPNGTALFTIRDKLAAWMRTIYLEDERGTVLLTIKRQTKLKLTLHATFTNLTVGDQQTLELVGSNSGSKAEITIRATGQVVAVLAFEMKGKDVLKNKQTYYCTVAPGIDLSIITALCLAWDECKQDDLIAATA